MFKTILLSVALDREDSEHALLARDTAQALVKGTGAALHVLTVHSYEAPALNHLNAEEEEKYAAMFTEQTREEVESALKDFIEPLSKAGIQVHTEISLGNPKKVILETLEKVAADTLVIGSHSSHNLLNVALGSTAHYLCKHAPCPVILASPSEAT